jgi:hypothetical protein
MSSYNFVDPTPEETKKKKLNLKIKLPLKKKKVKSEKKPALKSEAKLSKVEISESKATGQTAFQTVKADFKKYFNFQKSKLLQYPVDCPIDEKGRLHVTIEEKEEYSYLLSVQGYNLAGLSDSEYDDIVSRYWSFHKNYSKPFKEIYLRFPENNQVNQGYINRKIRNSESDQRPSTIQKNKFRKEEVRKFRVVEQEFKSKKSFVAVYGQTKEEVDDNLKAIIESGGGLLSLKKLEKTEIEILFELLNRGKVLEKNGDETFAEKTAPQDICFDYARHIPVNGHEEAIVVVTGLSTNVKRGWLLDFTNQANTDATTIDYNIYPKVDYSKVVSDSIEVLEKKVRNGKRATSKRRANDQRVIMLQKDADLEHNGETIKEVTIRMLVSAPTVSELEDKVETLAKKASGKGHQVQIYNNMGFYDWSSRFVSNQFQKRLAISRDGVERSSMALSLGFAHNQTYLADTRGLYYGRTKTQGSVYLDIFTKSMDRLSYDIFISGMKGSGKSTFLKKLALDNYIKDNYVYIFDKAREFNDLVRLLGGDYLSLDGANGLVNMFQVFPLVSKDGKGNSDGEDLSVDVWGSFKQHISKTINRFRNWIDISKRESLQINGILQDFYKDYYVRGMGKVWKHFDITALKNTEYPTFDDFYAFLNSNKVSNANQEAVSMLHDMAEVVVNSKREQFVGHTTMDNILKSQLIAFDISNITDGETGDADVLFDVTISLLFSMAQNRGRREKQLYEDGQKSFSDLIRTLIIVDECHNILNPNKLQAVELFDQALSENRKFYYGIALATQLVERMLPANAAQVGGNEGAAIQKLQAIIGLCQYKAWMRQSETSIPTLQTFFPTQFKPSDYKDMTSFKVLKNIGSEMILSGTGERGLEMYNYVTPYELSIFKGGA